MIWQIPPINPVAFEIGPLSVRWYGLMYLFGFLFAGLLLKSRASRLAPVHPDKLSDLLFYSMLGVILGGRWGYILFYQPMLWIKDPLFALRLWEPGMSFHGGLLGVLIALALFARRYHHRFLEVTDFVAPVVPVGLFLGRLGNFINGELWGRPTHLNWGVVFPQVDHLARHPSQLYEAFLEGLLLFTVLWYVSRKPQREGLCSGLFLMLYSIARFVVEFYREPDNAIGFIAGGWLTMGQVLCLPMGGIGLFLYWRKTCNNI